jgi:competence ComEA-like helix-hairpin-helix protein
MARFRLPQRRLDRVLPVAALLLCAGLLLLPLREEPYTETPFAERMEAVPEDLDEFLKLASTDINTADKEALMELPGIGEVLSDRILKYRAQYGPFADWSEFLQIQGIGEHLVETLRPVAYLG